MEDQDFWVSYSDMATGLLLIFILLVAFYVNQARKSHVAVMDVQEQVTDLLGRRDALALRLENASTATNRALGREVFEYDEELQRVVVETDRQEVVWFGRGSARLSASAREDVRVFYRNLYAQIMCAEPAPDGDVCPNPRVPDFLDAIEIQGHSDPVGRGIGQAPWSWEAFNGSASNGHQRDSNLQLSQERAKSIVDVIQQSYGPGGTVTDQTHPWRPFIALLRTSGRSWTSAWCVVGGEERMLKPSDFESVPPCVVEDHDRLARLEARSRRVSFGFRLDDREVLRELQALTQGVAP